MHSNVDLQFSPFISKGFVSLTGEEKDKAPITILCGTDVYHSFMLESILPLLEETSCGSDLLVWEIKMSVTNAPLHMVHLYSPLVTGHLKVAVHPQLPIKGISFILGNDFTSGQVFLPPEVINKPDVSVLIPESYVAASKVFPAYAITRAQARKMCDFVDLSESLMATLDEENDFSVTLLKLKM